jgi:hypothetical protein
VQQYTDSYSPRPIDVSRVLHCAYITGLIPGLDKFQFADWQYSPLFPKLLYSRFVIVMHAVKILMTVPLF